MLKEFWCKDLQPYVDSMLFDSGEQIAYMSYESGEWLINVSLEVCGEVRVEYKGESYRYPSEFPDELREKIKNDMWWELYAPSGEGNDETEQLLYVDNNNWFEYIYDIIKAPADRFKYRDGYVCEWDISTGTEEDIKADMLEVIEWLKGEK